MRPASRNKDQCEPSLVSRIETLEREFRQILQRIKLLESAREASQEFKRLKTDRRFFNSTAIAHRQMEFGILNEIKRRSLAKMRPSSIESDAEIDSDVDENRRDESPSNVKDVTTKANALPHHELAEREARLV
jgi:predicted transposase YbfD/YdcC